MIGTLHKNKIDERLKVAAYARISSKKAEQETSLEEQIDYYTRLIVQNQNWEFAGIYYDDGISGTTITQRKGFLTMVENARAGLIDIILVKSISRFGRNVTDLLTIVRELRNLGVEIYFEQQKTSSLDPKSTQMITMYAEFAEEEAISVSQNVKWRIEKNMKDGRYHLPTSQMMGYRYNEKGEVVIYEPEARIIQRIYKLYLDGYGCVQIADFLTKTKTLNRIGQIKWERSTIRNILRNEKFAGDFIFQKTFIESPLSHKEVTNGGQRNKYIVENGHPAIINRDDWNKVQEMMDENSRKYKVPSYNNGTYFGEKKENPLIGFIICPYCKSNYQYKANRHEGVITNRFLVCNSNRNMKLCESENYPYDQFVDILIESLNTVKKNKNMLKTMLIEGFSDNSLEKRTEEINELDTKINEHRAKLKEIEKYNDDFYMRARNNLLEIISDLTKKKVHLTNENLTSENVGSRINRIIRAINDLPDTISSLDDIKFNDIFSKAVIVNKSLIYFIIGNPNMKAYLKKPKLVFQSNLKYTVRRMTITTNYGILINR